MVCINCRKTVNDNLEFCPYCKCRLKAPARRQSAARPVNPPAASGNPAKKSDPKKYAPSLVRPQNPSSVPDRVQKKSAPAQKKPSPCVPDVRQKAKQTPPSAKTVRNVTKEHGGLNSFMAYFILPVFIIFDTVVIFSVLNTLASSENRISGIFTVCAQTVHLICAVAASNGLKIKSFSSLVFLLLCVVSTAVQTVVSLFVFANSSDVFSTLLILATAAITGILFAIFTPYYLKHKKEFIKNDILT